jgi:thiamine-phosphate diphosphorylase
LNLTTTPLGVLHFIVDLDVIGEDPASVLEPLLAAGLPSVQLRGKAYSTRELVEAGAPLRDAVRAAGARFVVNGDLDAARELDADGLQLPVQGPSLAHARRELGSGVAIGASCHDLREVVAARSADWVLLSPVFPTRSKPGAAELGLGAFRDLVAITEAPVYGLGGISRDNYEDCFGAGAAGVAAIRAFLNAASADFVRDVLAHRRI